MVRYLRPIAAAFAVIYLLCVASSVVAQQFPESTYQELRWRMIGPYRGGRTRALAGVPSQPNVFYIGAVNGGVWKSTDYGRTWSPIFDSQSTQSIGAIAIAPSDPNIIYVASGEGLARPDLSVGNGIYKSTDAGKTWTHLGLRNGQQIPGLAVDPRDPNHVLAAVLGHPYGPSEERGIYLSTDGGQNWTKVLSKNENTGGDQVEFDPSNPDVAYASMWSVRQGPWEDNNEYQTTDGGLFKSTDGGKTWRPLTSGLPKISSKFISPSRKANRAASMRSRARKRPANTAQEKAWEFTAPTIPAKAGRAPPMTAVRQCASAAAIFRCSASIRKIPMWFTARASSPYAPPTARKLGPAFAARRAATTIRTSGSIRTIRKLFSSSAIRARSSSVNGGETWSSWYNQPTAQIYHVSVSNEFPYKVCGGQQESGSVCTLSRGNDGEITFRDWHPVGAIEYGYVAPDPLNPDIIYGAGRNEVSKYHWSTGQVQNVSPFPFAIRNSARTARSRSCFRRLIRTCALHHSEFSLQIHGWWQQLGNHQPRSRAGASRNSAQRRSDGVSRSEKRRQSRETARRNLRARPVVPHGRHSLGRHGRWLHLEHARRREKLEQHHAAGANAWSKVTQISASHFDDESAYASVSRFRIDDLKPYIYRTHDSGKTWQLITAGLPDNAPVDTVREDPVRKGLLFAGTETSVWVSFDDGDHWQSLQLNLPHTSMRDLWIHEDDLILATHGRSFWILDDISPLRQINADTARYHGTCSSSPRRRFASAARHTPILPCRPTSPPAKIRPTAPSSTIPSQRKPTSGPVTIEILDAQGQTSSQILQRGQA